MSIIIVQKKVAFTSAAQHDLFTIGRQYERIRPGLREDFGKEFENTTEKIVLPPLAWRAISRNTRRCNMNRFPYAIIYRVKKDEIAIAAIMHKTLSEQMEIPTTNQLEIRVI